MITQITQTFIKIMRYYMFREECGNIIIRMFIEQKPVDYGSELMEEGSYFEFLVSGSMGKAGVPPQPKWTKAGEKKPIDKRTTDDMAMPYKRAHVNAQRVKDVFKAVGLKMVAVNERLTKDLYQGDIDLIVECDRDLKWGGRSYKKGDRFVIDLKYSGLLDNRWEKMGWVWTPQQKEYHGTQARQYHYISGMDFFFFVVGNKNVEEEQEDGSKVFAPTDMRVFYVPVDQYMIDKHIEEGNKLFQNLQDYAEIGFVPRPSYQKCIKCPIKDSCKDKHVYPMPVEVDLMSSL